MDSSGGTRRIAWRSEGLAALVWEAGEARSLRGGLGELAALVWTVRDNSPHWFGLFGEAGEARSLSGGRG
ncbi:MAG: hypothetical protein MR899_01845 [Clostridium sp.]|nr:hypothetical protein [Clostridium sp.]